MLRPASAVLAALIAMVPAVAGAMCETVLATDYTKVNKTGDTMTGSLIMSGSPISLTGTSGWVNSQSSVTASGFFGPLTGNADTCTALKAAPTTCTLPNVALGIGANGNATCSQPSNVTGNAATATALAATPAIAPSGFVSRGIDASGNVQQAAVDASAVSGSTNPVQSGALYTHQNLTGTSAHGATVSATANQIVARDANGGAAFAGITATSGTFTATGNTQYSVVASSGIKAALFVGDGSQLTNLPTAGGGAVLVATQTFSGSNTFTSSVTFSSSSFVAGIPGGVVASSTGINGAASTTLTGLNGNRDGAYRIVIDGRSTTGDGGLLYLLPNNDTGSHYSGTCWFMDTVDAWAGVNWAATSGMGFYRQATTNKNSLHESISLGASASSGGYRCMSGAPGWASEGGTYRGFDVCGGCWTDTSTNITSITINWGTSFIGSVYVYRDNP